MNNFIYGPSGQDAYRTALSEKQAPEALRAWLRGLLKRHGFEKIVIYGAASGTGGLLQAIVDTAFLAYVTSETVAYLRVVDYDAVLVGTSPSHYDAIVTGLLAAGVDKPVLLPFAGGKRYPRSASTHSIVVHGNCNCQAYAAALEEILPAADYEVRYYPNHTGEFIPDAVIGHCDTYIYQFLSPKTWRAYASETFLAALPAKAKTLRVPIYSFLPLWPFHHVRPDSYPRSDDYPYGLYPYGDTKLTAFAERYGDWESVYKAYVDFDPEREVDFDALLERHYRYYNGEANGRDINVYNLIMDNLQRPFLFNTVNHPAQFLLEYVLQRILSFLDVTPPADYVPYPSMFDFYQVPLHPAIARRFACDYAFAERPYSIYWKRCSLRDYIRGYVLDVPIHDHPAVTMRNFRDKRPAAWETLPSSALD